MLLCPSLMCADFLHLADEVDALCEAGSDILHLDVIDGHYVDTSSMGLADVRAVCSRSTVPCDVHLMATNAAEACSHYIEAGCSIVYVHPEADKTINSTLTKIARLGAHPGIAVNPGLSLEAVEWCLPLVDYVLIMTVNPGFAGQKFLDYIKPKISQFAQLKDVYGYKIIIDGACSPGVIQETLALGADGAVLGTSALFNKSESYSQLMAQLRQLDCDPSLA